MVNMERLNEIAKPRSQEAIDKAEARKLKRKLEKEGGQE